MQVTIDKVVLRCALGRHVLFFVYDSRIGVSVIRHTHKISPSALVYLTLNTADDQAHPRLSLEHGLDCLVLIFAPSFCRRRSSCASQQYIEAVCVDVAWMAVFHSSCALDCMFVVPIGLATGAPRWHADVGVRAGARVLERTSERRLACMLSSARACYACVRLSGFGCLNRGTLPTTVLRTTTPPLCSWVATAAVRLRRRWTRVRVRRSSASTRSSTPSGQIRRTQPLQRSWSRSTPMPRLTRVLPTPHQSVPRPCRICSSVSCKCGCFHGTTPWTQTLVGIDTDLIGIAIELRLESK